MGPTNRNTRLSGSCSGTLATTTTRQAPWGIWSGTHPNAISCSSARLRTPAATEVTVSVSSADSVTTKSAARTGQVPTGGQAGAQVVGEQRLFLVGYGDWTGPASATLLGVGRTARESGAAIVAILALG